LPPDAVMRKEPLELADFYADGRGPQPVSEVVARMTDRARAAIAAHNGTPLASACGAPAAGAMRQGQREAASAARGQEELLEAINSRSMAYGVGHHVVAGLNPGAGLGAGAADEECERELEKEEEEEEEVGGMHGVASSLRA
jgi:hypothetical protein